MIEQEDYRMQKCSGSPLVVMMRNLIKVYGDACSMTTFKEYMSGTFGRWFKLFLQLTDKGP